MDTRGTTQGSPQGSTRGSPQGNTQGSTRGSPQGNTQGSTRGNTQGSTQGTPPKVLRVAVIDKALPYATCETGPQGPQGIAVDLWKNMAAHYKWDYEFVCVERNYDKMLEDIRDDKYDIGIADFSVINRRFEWVLYTRPYYVASLKIARNADKTSGLPLILESNILHYVLAAVLVLVFIFAIVASIAKKKPFLDALYRTFITFFVGSAELVPTKENRKLPKPVVKPLNTVWIILIFAFRAFIISQIVSIFVQTGDFISENELKSVNKVLVAKGTSFVDYARQMNKVPIEVEDTLDIVRRIENSNDVYWFDDPIIMQNLMINADKPTNLHFTTHAIVNDEYALAVNKKFPQIKELMDKYIVTSQDNGEILKICKIYLDDDLDRCVL
jgi:hypothetical protein